jgi:hypothetical protein
MSPLITPIRTKVPPIAMGCLTTLFLLPFAIFLLPITLIARMANEFANRG